MECPLDAVALCFLLARALLMTSSHSEGQVDALTSLAADVAALKAKVTPGKQQFSLTVQKDGNAEVSVG